MIVKFCGHEISGLCKVFRHLIAARNFYRPQDTKVAAKYDKQFVKTKLVTIDKVFGGWRNAQKAHFADGGTFDQIYLSSGKR